MGAALPRTADPVLPEQIAAWVRDALPRFLDVSGSVIGVSAAAVRPGPFYIMGLNPGGDPSEISSRIGDPIPERALGWSVFTHDCWYDHCTGCPGSSGELVPDSHVTVHQRRVIELHRALGRPVGSIVTTNAVFARSQDEERMHSQTARGAWDWWKDCWPVHQRLLSVVRPHVIVALGKGTGTSAYAFLRDEAWGLEKRSARKLGRKAVRPEDAPLPDNALTSARTFLGGLPLQADDLDVLQVRVVGVPHPSRWPTNSAALDAIAKIVRVTGDGSPTDSKSDSPLGVMQPRSGEHAT